MSGVFDLQALVHAGPGYNDDLRMDLATARGHSPLFHLPDSCCPLIVAVGEPEPDEFRLQSRIFFEAWTSRGLPAQGNHSPGRTSLCHVTSVEPARKCRVRGC